MALLSFQIIIIFWLLKYVCLYDSYSGDISPYVKTRVNNIDSRVQVVSNHDAAERTKSAYLGASFKKLPQHCLKVQCSYTCFNGRQKEIVSDIQYAISISNHSESCDVIDELRLYNYEFINATVGIGFLSTFGDKVKDIYIAISNVTAIENGAFGEGIFNKIILEDLRLKDITNGIFRNISEDLKGIYITQREEPVQCIYPSFLDSVKFQIEHLVIRVGLECVRNVTAHDPVMGLLAFVDFSYNNFSSQLLEDTFSKLTMVERFVLSNSNIMYLPQYIFQGMEYLEYLDISHNKLKTISSSIFGSRTIAQNVRIIANDNVWHCDCTLQYEMNTIFCIIKTTNVLLVSRGFQELLGI
ncbi:uncharacterized protein LOC117889786 isoform X2 [Drosophila subobscura]|uniref:uncharacterized protein LOC117889786 isoform X2 n=1 Tax=Drosophila subobscura TaxID=7241 RepID=UPI00155A05F8|nr:uncharacterized protein LOC117889786 isoform X2 [Drosophila subobscura]